MWKGEVGETYAEGGVVDACGDRTKERQVAHRHLLYTNDMQI